MGLAAYDIVGRDGAWHVDHDGEIRNTYQTKEAAFEARHRSPCGRVTRSG